MDERNLLILIKGDERFIFLYCDESVETVIEDIYNKASDPAYGLNWYDAQVLVKRVRNPPDGGGLCP